MVNNQHRDQEIVVSVFLELLNPSIISNDYNSFIHSFIVKNLKKLKIILKFQILQSLELCVIEGLHFKASVTLDNNKHATINSFGTQKTKNRFSENRILNNEVNQTTRH